MAKLLKVVNNILKKVDNKIWDFVDKRLYKHKNPWKSLKEWEQQVIIEKQYHKNHPIIAYFIEFYKYLFYKLPIIPKKIKWFIQRGRKGYADCDVWGFDYYLAKVISEGLKELKKNKMGIPCQFDKYKNDPNLKKARKDYDAVLDKIIKGFKLAKQEEKNINYFPLVEYKKNQKNIKKVFQTKQLRGLFYNKKEVEKIDRAFDLFKKYFFCFWD